MQTIYNDGVALHVRVEGPTDGPVLLLSNSLGTSLQVWDPLIAHLPASLWIVRYDKRGHGLSDCPDAPYTMDQLVSDAEAVLDGLGIASAQVVGLSIGGLIGQGLARKRPDLVSKLVLMDTGAKIGTDEIWTPRIDAVRAGGMAAVADATMERWFTPSFHSDPDFPLWRNLFSRTPAEGYIGCAQAIMGADFRHDPEKVTCPVMGIVGSEDAATPPALMAETAALYGAPHHRIEATGHLPCVERPDETARLLLTFLDTGAEQDTEAPA